MSYSTVYGLWPNTEKRVRLAKFNNSWGMAPVVWNAMAQKYLGIGSWMWSARSDDLWKLHTREDIPAGDRAVLRMTFDTAYILAADCPRAIDDIALFLHGMQSYVDSAGANHWPTFATVLISLRADPPEAFGVHQTSVSDNPWDGPYNEKKEEYGPFDWTTAYSVYDGLPGRNR